MTIRKAEEKDILRIIELLGQVLQIHADIRPDIFIPGTTKYTVSELTELLEKEEKPIYVAVNEEDVCVGYAFCQLQEQPFSTNMVPFKSLFIDDLCVDQQARGQHIGESLFEYVKNEAKRMGCYEVTLNVWAGNTSAEKFYEKMGMKTKERQMEYILVLYMMSFIKAVRTDVVAYIPQRTVIIKEKTGVDAVCTFYNNRITPRAGRIFCCNNIIVTVCFTSCRYESVNDVISSVMITDTWCP